MGQLFVLNVINSIVGKRGNIGFRLNYVIDAQRSANINSITIARGDVTNNPDILSMGPFSYLLRGVNYLSKAYFRRLNGRMIDIALFNIYFIYGYYLFVKPREYDVKKIAHVCESSAFITSFLKRRGYVIIYDVPIAPSSYVNKIIKNGITKHLEYNSFLDRQERQCFDLADKIITPSKFVYNEIIELGISEEKVTIIPFGFEPKEVCNTVNLKKFQSSDNNTIFCFAGNISYRKGVDKLLEAWSDEAFNKDELHLCGKLFPDIKLLLDNYNFKNVITPGFVNTYEYLPKCDVYVFPSLMEGSSKSVYEAMACNLPVIATFESGSIVENGTDGLLVKAGDVDSLKQAMHKIKTDKDNLKVMAQAARRKVEQYPWDKYSSSVIKSYESASDI